MYALVNVCIWLMYASLAELDTMRKQSTLGYRPPTTWESQHQPFSFIFPEGTPVQTHACAPQSEKTQAYSVPSLKCYTFSSC